MQEKGENSFTIVKDFFNLSETEIYVLEAYCSYFFQIIQRYNVNEINKIVHKYPSFFKLLYSFFESKFDPKIAPKQRKEYLISKKLALKELLEEAKEKSLYIFYKLVLYTARTNYYVRNQSKDDYLISLKFKSSKMKFLPYPQPYMEIFVYGQKFLGIHLRAGKFARGGIRWSDRADFRTEVLALMRTQDVKNTIIVPRGAKGGFYIRKEYQDKLNDIEFVKEQYAQFIHGVLDITDNFVDGEIKKNDNLIIYDDLGDAYLTFAPDKGTGSFSDFANAIAMQKNFWLLDSFASGSSLGYNHKDLGITSRGAWESLKVHLACINKDLNKDLICMLGIGDMSGDVFGNGLLYSDKILLQAAFNHMHIFIDPNPDSKISYKERERLFKMPRSQWKDYDSHLISKGGGVFLRSNESIPVTEEIAKFLKLTQKSISGTDLIKAILKSEVDVIWNGGIGTYIKASSETDKDVKDRDNDSVRVNADELTAKIFIEGGNIGITQKARIEYSIKGYLINRDSIDNSGGVNLSDYEVNFKILLNSLVKTSVISLEEKKEIVSYFTASIVNKILLMNKTNAQALTLEILTLKYSIKNNKENYESLFSLMQNLVKAKILNLDKENMKEVELLKSELKSLKEKKYKRLMDVPDLVHRPELSILLAYERLRIKNAIMDSNIPELPISNDFLEEYFSFLREDKNCPCKEKNIIKYIGSHYLKRNIIAVEITNYILSKFSITFINDLHQILDYPYEEIIKIFLYLKNGMVKVKKDNLFSMQKQFLKEAVSSYTEESINALIENEEKMKNYIINFIC